MYEVAVLLPCFNSNETLRSQIATIKAQARVNVTIFAFDDGSTNGTSEILKSSLDSVRDYVITDDIAIGSASGSFFFLMRKVFAREGFDYFALSDHDDLWGPNKIIAAIERMQKDNSVGFSSGFLSVSYGKSSGIGKAKFCRKVGKRNLDVDFLFEGPGAGCTFVLTKEFATQFYGHLSEIGSKSDTIFWHDWYIYFFARARNLRWHISDESHLFYLQHETNVTGSNVGLKAAVKRFKQLVSGWYFEQIIIMADLVGCELDEIHHLKRMGLRNRLWLISKCMSFRSSMIHGLLLGVIFIFCQRKTTQSKS